MDHRIANTNVLTFADPGPDAVPDSIGVAFDLGDVPTEWGTIVPVAIRMEGPDIRMQVETSEGPHDLILANDSDVVAKSFLNFDQLVILGLDDDGNFALDVELPWSDRS